MAGESPDRSEQRKSSGAAAPGTGDPRLAVFSAVHQDADSDAVSGSQSGDARLRAAVAAWVTSADEPADDGADESAADRTRVLPLPTPPESDAAGPGAADAGPDAAPGGAEAASGPSDGSSAPTARTGASVDAGTGGGAAAVVPGGGDDGAGADADRGAATNSGDAAEPTAASVPAGADDADDGSGTGDRPALAADADPEPDTSAGPDTAAEAGGGSGGESGGESGGDDVPHGSAGGAARRSGEGSSAGSAGHEADRSVAASAVAEAKKPDGRQASVSATGNATAAQTTDPDASGAARSADASGGVRAADAPAGVRSAGVPAGVGSDAPADAMDRGAPAGARSADAPAGARSADASGGVRAADAPAGVRATDTPAGVRASDAPAGAADPDASAGATATGTSAGATATEASAGATDAGAPSDAAATGTSGVDQPTGVFRMPKRATVDQPTTTLRRSTFVPLRPDDVPGEREKPAAPAKAAALPDAVSARPAARPGPQPDVAERTRQQPLPPRPPLDLLAELTNTPPPRQTPVRTVLRRFKIWTPLALLLVVVLAVVQAVRPLPQPELRLTAASTYTFKGGALNLPWSDDGQSAVEVEGVGSLGVHGTIKPAPIASMAKVMTAYLVLQDHPLTGRQSGPKIKVDQQAADEADSTDESTAPIKAGQRYTEKQMLELLMVPSGNNAARLLSRWDGPTKDFIRRMNETAVKLGMTDTTYTDPSGLTATTMSTATDQLKLAEAVMKNDVFREIVNLPQVNVPQIPNTIYNNNHLLLKPGVSGIKTGSSTPAGGNLLWAADTIVDGKSRRILGVVMGQKTGSTINSQLDYAMNESYKLIKAGQQVVTSATVVKKGDVVGYVDDKLGGTTPVVATKDLKAIGWPGLKIALHMADGGKGDDSSTLPHSAEAGTVVGRLTIGSGPGMVTVPVALQKDLTAPGFGAKLSRLG